MDLGDDDFDWLGALNDIVVPIPNVNVFGNGQIQILNPVNVQEANNVPVYNVRVRVQMNDPANATFEDVSAHWFAQAYAALLNATGRQPNQNDYAQIRLLQTEGLVYDLTSDMLPADLVVVDFNNLYFFATISERIINMNGALLEYRFTFVLVRSSFDAAPRVNRNTYGALRAFANQSNQTYNNPIGQINPERQNQRFIIQGENNRMGRAAYNVDLEGAQRYERDQVQLGRQIGRNLRAANEDNAVPVAPNVAPVEEAFGIDLDNPQPIPQAPGPRRVRAPWTQEQRDRYNENRRQKRNRTVRGVYEDLKRKIFHHSSLEKFFLCSKAIDRVPTSWEEGFCLAMAFLHSQLRVYRFAPTLEIIESKPYDIVPAESECITCPFLAQYETRLRGASSSFIRGEEVVLFNPYKKMRSIEESTLPYEDQMSEAEVRVWYTAAQNMHQYVCEQVGVDLDPNEEATLQAYSDVFNVYVSVYRVEVQGKRTDVYRPQGATLDARMQDELRMVSILIGDSHAIAITSLREFLKTKMSANRTTIYNYCLFCEKMSTGNNESYTQSCAHYNKCMEKHKGQVVCQGDQLRRRMITTVSNSQFIRHKKNKSWACKLCGKEVVGGLAAQMDHVCYIKKPEKMKQGCESELYVYDMECAQEWNAENGVFIHKVNLVCVRKAYPDANGDVDRQMFFNLETFMEYIMAQNMHTRTYLAHNGSKYDVQFVLQYLEKNLIPHHFVPTPSSMHAYLSLIIPFGAKTNTNFLDFRHFMPGSLKNIGISFGLSVAKGDFPHHFNNGEHDSYEGRIPSLNHEKDYWCLSSKKTQEEVDEFVEWYYQQCELYCTCEETCTCAKRKWSFREEIVKYCWLDVDVLAEAVVKYRNNALEFGLEESSNEGWVSQGIDPFQYLTIPQLALNLLLGGLPEEENITITLPKHRRERCTLAIAWMERMSAELGRSIYHIGNSHREYLCPRSKRYVDGITDDKHVFICLNCTFHGCMECYYEQIETGADHPTRHGTFASAHSDTAEFVTSVLSYYGTEKTHIIWEHELQDYSEYECELGKIMKERDMFYGGRTEVFSPYVNMENIPTDDLKYYDVCSLYPYVCAFKTLPTGHPEHYIGTHIDMDRLTDLNHPNPYFGYVRCRVRPNPSEIIGLLPFRDPASGRLEFPLHEMTGSWGTEELRLALEGGYRILAVYEVYHWSENERSNTLMRGYVSFFLRMKQEAEGWKKLGARTENPSVEEQLEIQERVFQENGCIGRIRIDKVQKNPVRRQMAKLFLNSLWGKFCQSPHSENYTVIHGYQQFADLWFNPTLNRNKFSFRNIGKNTWKVKYCTLDDFTRPNNKYNIFLSSKVTEWARCILHRQMRLIGAPRILYCDTDSIMFLWPKDGEKLDGCGLGNWVDEYPGKRIQRLYALAPKFYYLEFENDHLLKSKGIQMTLANTRLIHGRSLGAQIMELMFPQHDEEGRPIPFQNALFMKNMIIGVNSINANLGYGTMTTRYTQDKKLRPVFSKRLVVPYLQKEIKDYNIDEMLSLVDRMFTIPKGYVQSVENMSVVCYEHLQL